MTTTTARAVARVDGEQYVLGVATSAGHYAVHTTSATGEIYLLDKNSLATTSTLTALGAATAETTALRFSEVAGRRVLLSAHKGGAVAVWDDRVSRPAMTLTHPSAASGVLAIDALADHNLVAAGTALHDDDATILYWDPRSAGAPTHTHASTHSDDITALHFRPAAAAGADAVLLSGSSDGLVCTSNAAEHDEDEAAVNVVNYGSSVAHAGWAGSGQVWASTDMETAALWTGELDVVRDFGDVRKPDRTPLAPDGAKLNFKTDYVVDGFAWGGELCLVLGSNEGDAVAVAVSGARPDEWRTRQILRGAHAAIVRCVAWDAQAGVLVTGGEDAVVALWRADGLADEPDVTMDDDGGGSGRRKRGRDDGDGREGKRARV